VQIDHGGDILFNESHIRPLQAAQNQVLRCLVSTDPSRFTWKEKLRAEISARVSLLLHAMSKSLVWNQIIQIPGLLGPEAFFEDGIEFSDTTIVRRVFHEHWQTIHRIFLLTFVGITGIVYGGIHAMKWNEQFPTAIEQHFWQVSSCVGALGIVPVVLLGMPSFSSTWIFQERPRQYFNSACVVCGMVTGLAFVIARTYLVVESFLSIRSLPASSFQVVKWLDLFSAGHTMGQE
jgi:hypothetical protein